MLQGQLDDNLLGQLSAQLGADKEQTATAASGILSTLVGGLAKNASTPEGAAGLANALDRDHDGSILDNLMGMLGGAQAAPQQPKAVDGAGILGHILGGKQGGAIDMISQMSGLQSDKTGSLMTMLAPMVMGMLGKQKKEQGLDISGLTGMLTGSVNKQQEQGNPLMNLATSFLDKDGDGSIMDDVAGMIGSKMLGGLFGGK